MVKVVSAEEGKEHACGSDARRPYRRSMRLLRHSDFERVYQQGRRHFSANMTVFFLRREDGRGARVGYTVGRVLGNAVVRNRMKRRLREAVRLNWTDMKTSLDIVINPKKSLLTLRFEDLMKETGRAFDVIRRG